MRSLILMILLLPQLLRAQVTIRMSLEEAVEAARRQSAALRIAEGKRAAASARAKEVGVQLLPSLKFEAGYRRLSDVDPFRVSVPFLTTPITISPVVLDNYTLRLSLQQPVFTGFRLVNASRSAQYTADAADLEYTTAEADLTLNVRTAYWMLYQSMQVKKAVGENVERLAAHLRDTDRLVAAGVATKSDRLKIEVQYSNARLAEIDAETEVRLAQLNLNMLLGQNMHIAIEPTSVPTEAETLLTKEPTVSEALQSRSDVQSMQLRIRAAEASVSAARGGWWPQIALGANLYHSRPNPRYMPTRDEFKSTWDVGLQLQFDIWNWGLASHQTEQAKAQLTQTRAMADQLEDQVVLEVTIARLKLSRSKEKIAVARLGVAQAGDNLRATTEKYGKGLATSAELLDAEVALLQARTNETAALVEHEIARARLDRALGQ